MQNGNIDKMMNQHREKMVRTNATVIWGMLGFAFPLLLVVAVWKINTADGQIVNFFNTDAWIPTNLEEQKMQLVMPMYAIALLALVTAFVVPNFIGKLGPKELPKSANTAPKTASPHIFFLKFVLRVVLLEMTTLLGFVAALLARQAELIIPFFIVTIIGAAMSSPKTFIENK